MPKPSRELLRKLLFIPPIIAGGLFLWYVVSAKGEPRRNAAKEVARVLRVIQAPEVEVLPRAIGYGTVEPGNVWQAVAEVKGRVIEVSDDLEAGAIINRGDLVLKIDPKEYDLAMARLDAEIEQARAQLDELNAQKANEEASLKIEVESLTLAENELARLRELLVRKATTPSAVEKQQRTVLTQRQSVQSLNNSLRLKPSGMKAITSNIAVKQAQRDQALLDKEKTVITAPFSCRVGPVAIEVGQFLAVGQSLFEAHNVDLVEVEAQMAPRDVRNLLHSPRAERALLKLDMETMRAVFQLDAVIRLGEGVEWPAVFSRVRENMDPETRTIGVVFKIDDPYSRAIPSDRPPPLPGAFCEVEVRSRNKVRHVIVPRNAVHDVRRWRQSGSVVQKGFVYVVGADERLESREVQLGFAQSGFVTIMDGLAADETVVVSDPTPAVEMMKVQAVTDAGTRDRLVAAASGEGDVR